MNIRKINWLALCLAVLFLAGCVTPTTQPSRFYMLHSLYDLEKDYPEPGQEAKVSLGIGPINIPDYLDRPQIVTKTGSNQINVGDFDRWAGALKSNINVVLVENLSILLETNQISVYPRRGNLHVDYRVTVDISRLDGTMNKGVLLIARWTLYETESKEELLVRSTVIEKSSEGLGYESLVAAQSQALLSLSQDIAKGVQELLSQKKGA